MVHSVADLGGGGGVDAPLPSGLQPSADPKGPPFALFWDIYFCLTDLKIFLKAPLTPIYNNFEGGARAEKTQFFLVEIFQKVPKNAFFDFFQKLACGGEMFVNLRSL